MACLRVVVWWCVRGLARGNGYVLWLGAGLVYIGCICVYGSWFGGALRVWLEGMVMGRG